jgi:hypothetical protein
MTNSKYGWFKPIPFFAWGSGWLYAAIHLLAGGELWFSWTRGATRILVRRDTPYYFWGCVSLFFLLALVAIWAGIVELRKYLRQRRTQSATMMQDLQRHMISRE